MQKTKNKSENKTKQPPQVKIKQNKNLKSNKKDEHSLSMMIPFFLIMGSVAVISTNS